MSQTGLLDVTVGGLEGGLSVNETEDKEGDFDSRFLSEDRELPEPR